MAISLLDSLIIQMQDRFSDEDRHTRHLLYLSWLITPWSYLKQQKACCSGRMTFLWQSAEKVLPSNLLLALGGCDEDAFPNIHRLLLIACTLPINSAEAKRSFSLMKRIKTCTRLTMCEEHFSDLAIIAMHYPERFEVDEICEAFVKAHPRRLFQATLFD